MVDIAFLKELLEIMYAAEHSTGECMCGSKMISRLHDNHSPVDIGDRRAEQAIEKLKKMIEA